MAKRKRGAKKRDESDLQPLAVTFLLCAPSTLQDTWLKSEDTKVWEAALTKLKIKDTKRALKIMTELSARKTLFAAVGELLHDSTEEYGEDPPHPTVTDAQLLVDKLK